MGQKLKMATWNMGYWQHPKIHEKAWDYLFNEISPDIALVQEARPPGNTAFQGCIWKPVKRVSGKEEKWGSGVLTKSLPLKELEFRNCHPGALVGAEVELPGNKVLSAFSLYGLLDEGYATTTVHRMLSDLTFILMGKGEYKGKNRNVLLGGDLNISVQWDEKYGKEARYTHAHKLCFDRIEDFGLTSCFSKNAEYVQTLRYARSNVPWQNDYLFTSKDLKAESCNVISDPKIFPLSDHNPVVIELSL